MTEGKRVSVSLKATVGRINRALAQRGRMLRKVRGADPYLASWYVVDLGVNAVVETGRAPEELARELGVLHPWEEVDRGS